MIYFKLIFIAFVTAGCGTMLNLGGDKQITITSYERPKTKFFHNGRFIGRGNEAITYASGTGTDVLSSTHPGCVVTTTNVKKSFAGGALATNLIPFFLGILLTIVEPDEPSKWLYSGAGFFAFATTIDAASGSLRSVDYQTYDLTPICP